MSTTGTEITFDLNEMLNDFLCKRLDAYEEPKNKREGKPFKQVYNASLMALTSRPLAKQAELLGIGYGSLKATRSTEKFKALVEDHLSSFAGEVVGRALGMCIAKTGDRWQQAQDTAEAYRAIPVQILYGYQSWDCYRRIIGAVTTATLDASAFRLLIENALGQKVAGLFLYLAALELQTSFLGPLLEGGRQGFNRPKKELEVFRSAALDAQMSLCCQQVLVEALDNETPERERLVLIRKYLAALMRAQGVAVPK